MTSKTWNVDSLQVKRGTSDKWNSQNPILKAGEIGYDSTNNLFKIGNGTANWKNLPHFAPKTLDAYSWSEISTIAESGNASSFFKVGDEKNITLSTGEMVTLIILGFDHDTKTAGGTAGITFGMKNLLATTYPMNSSNTNSGGWTSSVMRTSTMATLLSQLPSDLQSVIKPVNKLTSAGAQSTTINTDSDSLFLLSQIEVFGSNSYSVAGEGTQYAYYKDIANTSTLRIKKLANGTGSANYWWLRSPYASSSASFCLVNGGGRAGGNLASDSGGVAFGFCI